MFDVYEAAKQLVREIAPIVPAIRKFDRELASQLSRATTSVMLNIGEGRGRTGGDQRRFFEIANGSANEVRTALDCADCWGWPIAASAARATLDRIIAMLWRLTRPRT